MVDDVERYDERGAMARMLAADRLEHAEPFAIVLSTVSGTWFFAQCREHRRLLVSGRTLWTDKSFVEGIAARHNEEHARGGLDGPRG